MTNTVIELGAEMFGKWRGHFFHGVVQRLTVEAIPNSRIHEAWTKRHKQNEPDGRRLKFILHPRICMSRDQKVSVFFFSLATFFIPRRIMREKVGSEETDRSSNLGGRCQPPPPQFRRCGVRLFSLNLVPVPLSSA